MFLNVLRRPYAAAVAKLACLVAFASSAQAQHPGHSFANHHPIAHALHIMKAQAPHIDGDLSDPIWQKAVPIDSFFQTEPREGAPASERTVVRVAYDDDNLYFAVSAYDQEPSRIVARLKQRDADLNNDDSIRIYIDPNMTRRDAFVFQVNPLGARRDGLLQANINTLYEWNAIWTVKTRTTPEGWTAEIAIPFRSISFDHHGQWGLEIGRIIRRKNELVRWSSVDRAMTWDDVSRAGTLDGLEAIHDAGRLDLLAFALTRYRKNWDGEAETGVSFRPSGNLFYKITPSLTGTLTYNTDFSDAPLDQRQVNTSRFSLFYPERRDFFLQDAATFEFGGRSLTSTDNPNGAPFFSRRIGVVKDIPVNIIGGAKLSGSYDGIGIGALSVRTAGGAGVEEQTLSVLRLTAPLGDGAKLGAIVTNGDPTGASNNTVAGGDVQYRTTSLFGAKTLQLDSYFERSFSNIAGQDNSFGLSVVLPNEPWNQFNRFKQVDTNFDPALGFVARAGIREYTNITKYRQRFSSSFLRWNEWCLWAYGVTDLNNKLKTGEVGFYGAAFTEAGDYFQLEWWMDKEVVDTPFQLPKAIVVPRGDYTSHTFHTNLTTNPGRFIAIGFDGRYEEFFGGHRVQTDTTLNFNPNETYTFSLRHVMQDLKMPNGNVTVQVASIDSAVNFTPDMQLRGQLQYDNISKALELSARYRWEFEPGSELLVVVGDDATLRGTYYQSHMSQFSIRLGKTFRF